MHKNRSRSVPAAHAMPTDRAALALRGFRGVPVAGAENNGSTDTGRRMAVVVGLLLAVTLGHWLTPNEPHYLHVIHVTLGECFLLPVVLAAVWFDLGGALLTAAGATLLYVPYMLTAWSGQTGENINQAATLATVWMAAVLVAVLAGREKRALRERAMTHEGALVALVSALDAREHNTRLHSQRVRAYSMRLGREMNLDARELSILGEAALLHDIGKIGVPDSVLLKPGPLSAHERQAIEAHPEIGRRILEPIPLVRAPAEIVHAHHEKYDGTGYPRGLKGEGIVLGARVFAVVDVLDALTSERPYRECLSFEAAAEVIRAGSGSHFDPEVVESFKRIPTQEWDEMARAVAATAPQDGFIPMVQIHETG